MDTIMIAFRSQTLNRHLIPHTAAQPNQFHPKWTARNEKVWTGERKKRNKLHRYQISSAKTSLVNEQLNWPISETKPNHYRLLIALPREFSATHQTAESNVNKINERPHEIENTRKPATKQNCSKRVRFVHKWAMRARSRARTVAVHGVYTKYIILWLFCFN